MLATKPVGCGAASRKYDLLTALGAYALAREKHTQRLVLRFITLIVARYNWAANELNVGQREIARLWSVNERTVKREMARLRSLGWLVVKRQGARGRVTTYGMSLETVLAATRSDWARVGPDFELRMAVGDAPETTVVPFPKIGPAPDISDGTEWALASAVLHQDDPTLYAAWLQPLERVERAGGRLTLRAPSQFHASYVLTHHLPRIAAALEAVDGTLTDVQLVV